MKVFEKKNIYSAWLAVDDNGTEKKYFAPPKRNLKHHEWWGIRARLSKGSIKKLIGRELTWEDEPVEIKEEE